MLWVVAALASCQSNKHQLVPTDDAGQFVRPKEREALATSEAVPKGKKDGPADIPFVECPVRGDIDAILNEAGSQLEAGSFAAALSCADVAADLVPQAVEAHHLRAAALAELGDFGRAQVGFAMALALDPDDPQTLAAAANFYINILSPKERGAVRVGLEYARRGSGRAAARRRLDRNLRARLFLLEAEAQNDLGYSDLALPRLEEALDLVPSLTEAHHEKGVTLFNLCRFPGAEKAFLGVLRHAPEDPFAHHYLGLIYERLGRVGDAEAHFERARRLAPGEFSRPIDMSPMAFRAEVDRAISELSPSVQADLESVNIELVDLPADEDIMAVDPPFAPTIMGLYRGLPLGVDEKTFLAEEAEATRAEDQVIARGRGEPIPARAIVLYRKNLIRAARTREELNRQIRCTLAHEIGHLHGLDEEELRRRGLD